MLFNSLEFLIFLPIVFIIYWFLLKKDFRAQNILLLVMSYVFYAWWDWRFLFLLFFSTALDYLSGIKIFEAKTNRAKKFWLILSISLNLGFLGFFKYYNFFIASLRIALEQANIHIDTWSLEIVLPVGISFYTFHGLSYVIDIYYRRIEPSRNWVNYSVFVSYFPLLVAGPIERATHLLPQIEKPRKFDYNQAFVGLRLAVWGFFKKVAVADNIAPSVNEIFENYQNQDGSVLLLGAFLFSIQIYGDFSGYSDIARGISKFFGIELLVNFNFPYFSRNIAEFWRRWHISLSSWFKDYVYIPLGGSRVGLLKNIRNIFIIFLLSGFWHGANWTFIIWGLIHALYFIPNFLFKTNRNFTENIQVNHFGLPKLNDILRIFFTFVLVMFAWIFFRAPDVQTAVLYIKGIFYSFEIENIFEFINPYDNQVLQKEYLLILILILVDYFIITKPKLFSKLSNLINWIIVLVLLIIITLCVPINSESSFIYFQF
jgi:D-alanyl-lipoteichoic acid acyltransferase DltB (MBOAT superfamily)